MSNDIIVSQEYLKLQEEVNQLRTELSMLVLERDELVLVTCKNIEMLYMLKIGNLEYKLYELSIKIQRERRKMQLIQANINRVERINMSDIEDILNQEFLDYQEQLNEKLNTINKAIERSNGKVLTDEQIKEIKAMYRKIVKCLHPDLNPNVSKQEIQLFQNAVAAYENGDLEGLTIISEMLGKNDVNDDELKGLSQLEADKKGLSKILDKIHQDIALIKSTYPYTMKELVNDDRLIKNKQNELKEIMLESENSLQDYHDKIREMLVKDNVEYH